MAPQAVLSGVRWVSIAAALLLAQACEVGVYTASCSRDDQIPQETRDEIEAAAIRVIGALDQSPEHFAGNLSSRGKIDAKPEAMSAVIASHESMDTISEPIVAQTFFVTSSASTNFSAGIPCGSDDDGRMTFAPRGGTITNALVLADQNLRGDSKITHTLWLENEEGKWLLRGFHTGVSAISGLDSEQLWNLAKQQREKGNLINASLLYTAGGNALDRGPFFQPSLLQDFVADKQTFEQPTSMDFTFEQEAFAVTDVLYIGLSNGLFAIGINHTPAAGAFDEEVEAINRRLIAGFDKAYPEWRDVFKAVVGRAIDPSANTVREAVFSLESGYLELPLP